MKTVIQDPQLEYELEELYISSRHWLSDIRFEEDEIRFLKNVLIKYRVPATGTEQLNEIEKFTKTLTLHEENISVLKNKISALLKFIGSLIIESDSEIKIDLVEKFAALQTEMATLFENIKQVKKLLFSFIEDVMRTECDAFINQIN